MGTCLLCLDVPSLPLGPSTGKTHHLGPQLWLPSICEVQKVGLGEVPGHKDSVGGIGNGTPGLQGHWLPPHLLHCIHSASFCLVGLLFPLEAFGWFCLWGLTPGLRRGTFCGF